MGSMIRIYREVEERLAEAAGAMTHHRSAAAYVAPAAVIALFLSSEYSSEMELSAIFCTATPVETPSNSRLW